MNDITVRGRASGGRANASIGSGGSDLSRKDITESGRGCVGRAAPLGSLGVGGGGLCDARRISGSDVTGCTFRVPTVWLFPIVSSDGCWSSSYVPFDFLCSAMSTSGPREEAGEGKILDGAVGGDIPGDDKPSLGEVVEGNDGVDE